MGCTRIGREGSSIDGKSETGDERRGRHSSTATASYGLVLIRENLGRAKRSIVNADIVYLALKFSPHCLISSDPKRIAVRLYAPI